MNYYVFTSYPNETNNQPVIGYSNSMEKIKDTTKELYPDLIAVSKYPSKKSAIKMYKGLKKIEKVRRKPHEYSEDYGEVN